MWRMWPDFQVGILWKKNLSKYSNFLSQEKLELPKKLSNLEEQKFLNDNIYTPPVAEILCVKNGRAIVVCGFLMKSLKKTYTESLKKIVGAVWELPAK